jgi:hypothetical protein
MKGKIPPGNLTVRDLRPGPEVSSPQISTLLREQLDKQEPEKQRRIADVIARKRAQSL